MIENNNNFYSMEELKALGFKHVGQEVYISRKASLYGCGKMSIGNHVRVDDFCILSGKVEIGNYVHVAAYSALYGGEDGVHIDDFANISSRVSVYSVSDDYSGETMTNPMVPDEYKKVTSAPVHIGEHVIIGSTSVILPGVKVAEGGSFGCFSLIKEDTEPWWIYTGIPCKKLRERSKKLLKVAEIFVKDREKR